jgi:nucleoside-diphosphate-sugar epimerase
VQSVESLVQALAGGDPRRRWARAEGRHAHEAHALALSIERARLLLGWSPVLSFAETVSWTEEGYGVPTDRLPALIARQISEYEARRGLAAPAVVGR